MNKAFKEILERLEEYKYKHRGSEGHYITITNDLKEIVQEVAEEYGKDINVTANNGWIPVKLRPMTEDEKRILSEYLFEGNGMIYECPLPDDGQEVLITTKYGSVEKTTYYTDCGNYFENYEDYDEVIAWQPLPEPYKDGEKND